MDLVIGLRVLLRHFGLKSPMSPIHGITNIDHRCRYRARTARIQHAYDGFATYRLCAFPLKSALREHTISDGLRLKQSKIKASHSA